MSGHKYTLPDIDEAFEEFVWDTKIPTTFLVARKQGSSYYLWHVKHFQPCQIAVLVLALVVIGYKERYEYTFGAWLDFGLECGKRPNQQSSPSPRI